MTTQIFKGHEGRGESKTDEVGTIGKGKERQYLGNLFVIKNLTF
jgi:hypothetical protein